MFLIRAVGYLNFVFMPLISRKRHVSEIVLKWTRRRSVVMSLCCDGSASMADSVTVRRGGGSAVAVPLT